MFLGHYESDLFFFGLNKSSLYPSEMSIVCRLIIFEECSLSANRFMVRLSAVISKASSLQHACAIILKSSFRPSLFGLVAITGKSLYCLKILLVSTASRKLKGVHKRRFVKSVGSWYMSQPTQSSATTIVGTYIKDSCL